MSPRTNVPVALALAAGLALAGSPALAADRDAAGGRGAVDGSAFGKLASEDDTLIEIHLGSALLGAIARGASDDPDAAALLGGLRSVSAYIVSLGGDAGRTAKATKLIKDVEARLDRDGWERLATVREKGDRVNVFALGSGGMVEGLVVLVLDQDESKVVFANLTGALDLAKLGSLKGALDVPGLDALSGAKHREGSAPTPPPKKGGSAPDAHPEEEFR